MNSLLTLPTCFDPGVYDNLPAEQYHADTAVGSSTLKKLATMTPAHAKYGSFQRTDALEFGAAFDMCLLEREIFNTTYLRGPDDRRGKKWTEALDACERGQILMVAKDYDRVLENVEVVLSNPDVASLLSGNTIRQQSAFWIDKETGLRCKARPDLINEDHELMVDVKTTISADPRMFGSQCAKLGYHIQRAQYLDGYNGKYDRFLFLAIEKKHPFLACVYEMDQASAEAGYVLYRAMLNKYKQCSESGVWPGYPSGIQPLSLPTWAIGAGVDLGDTGEVLEEIEF